MIRLLEIKDFMAHHANVAEQIYCDSFPLDKDPHAAFYNFMQGSGLYVITLLDDEGQSLQGFLLYHWLLEEGEIYTIAVDPSLRGQGLGKYLLEALLHEVRSKKGRLFLEVAADNAVALSLYGAAGFEKMGVRKAYYRRKSGAPVDAVTMSYTV